MILSFKEDIANLKACPHTRGDDPCRVACVHPVAVLVPTRVGMILQQAMGNPTLETCPHTRGDDPYTYALTVINQNLSPHAWG